MGTLEVCGEGLNVLSGQCTAIASRLASQVPSPAVGPPAQATVAAVGSAYAVLDATAAVLAARVHTAGRKLTTAASRYVGTDETSAQQLSELSGGPGQV
ncbi:type VII secretion target [Mycolicibacterium sphagni]|uniref:ESX-1 secretion-associated protein n=1 Tax=Mycolicibacterium sphagni TaxID=1786 RepID=A0ABX2K708_9MYCO|nr:hypothetical protein [Mycolicibacterium sphagni]